MTAAEGRKRNTMTCGVLRSMRLSLIMLSSRLWRDILFYACFCMSSLMSKCVNHAYVIIVLCDDCFMHINRNTHARWENLGKAITNTKWAWFYIFKGPPSDKSVNNRLTRSRKGMSFGRKRSTSETQWCLLTQQCWLGATAKTASWDITLKSRCMCPIW